MGILSWVGSKVITDHVTARAEAYNLLGRNIWKSGNVTWNFGDGDSFTVEIPEEIQVIMRRLKLEIFDLESAGPVDVYLNGSLLTRFVNVLTDVWQTKVVDFPAPTPPILTLEAVTVGTVTGLATIPFTKNRLITAAFALAGFTTDVLIRRAGRGPTEEAFDFLY